MGPRDYPVSCGVSRDFHNGKNPEENPENKGVPRIEHLAFLVDKALALQGFSP